eukprot:s3504_g4.t1
MSRDVEINMKNLVTCAMKPDKHGKCRFEFLCIRGLDQSLASGSPLDSEWIPIKIRAVQGHSKAVLKRAGGSFAPATLMYCHPNVDPDRKAAFASVPISPMSEVPEVIYHRTMRAHWRSIVTNGLIPGGGDSVNSGRAHVYGSPIRYGADGYKSGLRGKCPVELKIALRQAVEAGSVWFRTKTDGILTPEQVPSQFIISAYDTEKKQMLWTRAESNLAPESWQGTSASGGQATSVNLVSREDRDLGDEDKRSARKREEEDDAARAEQPPARVRRVYIKPSHNEPFLGTCPLCQVEYVSGQQVCHCCGFDELPIDDTGKLKFQPNRKTILLERRMEKLNKFGVFGTINQSLLSSLTDQQAAELRQAVGKRGLTSVEASVLNDAKDKLRRAKTMGYEGVEDRYASDAQFCDRVHQEGKGVQDCIQRDLLAYAHLPDPSRTRKQISAGVAANAEYDHLLTKLIYIDHPHGLQGFPPEFRHLEKEWAFMFGRHLMSEAEFLTYLQKPRTHRGLLTWNGVIQIPALGEHGAGTTYLEGVYEANLPNVKRNIQAKKGQSLTAKEANKKRKADEQQDPPGAPASSSGQPAAPADTTGDQAATSQDPSSWLGDTAKASAPPPEPAAPPARGSGSARADAPSTSWSWNRDYYGSTLERTVVLPGWWPPGALDSAAPRWMIVFESLVARVVFQ